MGPLGRLGCVSIRMSDAELSTELVPTLRLLGSDVHCGHLTESCEV